LPVDNSTRSLHDLLLGVDVLEMTGDTALSVRGVACDSRKVSAGEMFVAIRGTKQDGGRFVDDAVNRGAVVIVSEDAGSSVRGCVWVRVSNARKALALIAANHYGHPSSRLNLIGITGTNGKTTTSLLIESILRHEGYSVGVLGTLAYRWMDQTRKAPMTTPESLDLQQLFHEMLQAGVSHVVMEVSSHALALGRVDGCAFGAALFTNLSQDHLDFHQDMESYFRAKSILFHDLLGAPAEPGVAIINRDDPYGFRLIEETAVEVWSYSVQRRDARVWVKTSELAPTGILAVLYTSDGELTIRSPLMGRLNLYNLVSAATTALALGVSKKAIVEGLAAVSQVDGRLQRVPLPADVGFEIVVDYAHTPDAMMKTLSCLREMTRNRLIVVFGCGGDRDRGKRPLMGEIAAKLGDLIVVTSDNPRTEEPERIIDEIVMGMRSSKLLYVDPSRDSHQKRGYTVVANRREAIRKALAWAQPGDLVFIGGKGHETYQIIGSQVLPFDDREVVREFFQFPTS
jgi:UDP-N-acetylmuramoyl-L-alanyl-D-glutamate--2,6-diaminopimelate ligase